MKKIWLLLIILGIFTGCAKGIESFFVAPFRYKEILLKTDNSKNAKISEYTIYGKYFNVNGFIEGLDSYDSIMLSIKSQKAEVNFPLIANIGENGELLFKTNEKINEGINLEKIPYDNYVILLKVTNKDITVYYNMFNTSSYDDLDYYTITKNKTNNHIMILFSEYQEYNFMKMEFNDKQNSDICDIVIDPGHGGNDPGASNGNYLEKDFNLDYSLLLKEELENIGLKVKLTRDSDVSIKNYGYNSRTSLSYECKAKLMLSLHLNSTDAYVKNGGVEIYTAYNDNYDFAKLLADNIVVSAKTSYSPNTYNKVIDGVYMRTYSDDDITSLEKDATDNGWNLYENVSTNSTYYYFIRETGGIITGALTDGRNPDYDKNPYYNSNHGVEAYLVELGYLSNSSNLQILENDKDGYIKGLVDSIKTYINN